MIWSNILLVCIISNRYILANSIQGTDANQNESHFPSPFANKHVHDNTKHSHPTLLKVVDTKSNELIHVLDNDLYKELKYATFYDDELTGTNAPTSLRQSHGRMKNTINYLLVDKNVVNFKQSLTILSTPSNTNHGSLSTDRSLFSTELSSNTNYNDDDVIAMYCPANEPNPRKFRDAATVAQAKLSTSTWYKMHSDDIESIDDTLWFIPSFPIIREEYCQFRLWRREQQQYSDSRLTSNPTSSDHTSTVFSLVSKSVPIQIKDSLLTMTAIHMSLREDPTEITIQFTTGAKGIPMVQVMESSLSNGRPLSEQSIQDTAISYGKSTTYTNTDMCQEPANSTDPGKFIDPGFLHAVIVPQLTLDTDYTYRVGLYLEKENITVWNTDEDIFHSAPQHGSNVQPFSFLAFGDQGSPIGTDWWAMGGNLTAALIQNELDRYELNHAKYPVRLIHHFGDISYAMGLGHAWDEWFDMISIYSSRVPLMIGVGNHEYDYTDGGYDKDPSSTNNPSKQSFSPEWGNFGKDSGGECGVPTSKRFVVPSTGNLCFWYSYVYATVTTIMISSEHDLSQGSEQYIWLEQELAQVNRTETPWLIVESHRPMYMSEEFWSQNNVSIAMRQEFEYLLYKYKVDIMFAGHYHSYLRTCDRIYQSKCDNGGTLHITVGTAGAELDLGTLYNQGWTESFIKEWGIGRVTVYNETTLHWEFVSAHYDKQGKTLDDYWVYRNRELE